MSIPNIAAELSNIGQMAARNIFYHFGNNFCKKFWISLVFTFKFQKLLSKFFPVSWNLSSYFFHELIIYNIDGIFFFTTFEQISNCQNKEKRKFLFLRSPLYGPLRPKWSLGPAQEPPTEVFDLTEPGAEKCF